MKRERLTEEEAYFLDLFRSFNSYGRERLVEQAETMYCSGLYDPVRIIKFTPAEPRKNDLL